jgi:hypothetical protein
MPIEYESDLRRASEATRPGIIEESSPPLFNVGGKSPRSNLDKINQRLERQLIARPDLLKALSDTGEKGAQRPLQALLGAKALYQSGLPESKLVEAARKSFTNPVANEVPILASDIREINKYLRHSGRSALDANALGAYYPLDHDIVVRAGRGQAPVQSASTTIHEIQHALERLQSAKSKRKTARLPNGIMDDLQRFVKWSEDHHVSEPYNKKSFELGKLLEMLKSDLSDTATRSTPIDLDPPSLFPPEIPITTPPKTNPIKFPTIMPPEAASELAFLQKQLVTEMNLTKRLAIAKRIEELENALKPAANSMFKNLFKKD